MLLADLHTLPFPWAEHTPSFPTTTSHTDQTDNSTARQKQFYIYWEPGQHNLEDLPTKHHSGTHHQRLRPICTHENDKSPLSIQVCIQLLSKPSNKLADNGTRKNHPIPTIAHHCQLSHTQAVELPKHKPGGPHCHYVVKTVTLRTLLVCLSDSRVSRYRRVPVLGVAI